jgi:CBS domain-containing protein
MIQQQVHRLVVFRGASIVGLLEQLDLLSLLSNHSYLITVQIVRAQDLPALREQAERITRFIALLYRGGTPVGQIAALVQALNAKLFERTWQLVAPAELVANSCLFVMGSEGRGEQLLKTDQDNGLILRDGAAIDETELAEACARFSAALRDFGYPDCPGGLMLSRPAWRLSASAFASQLRHWLLRPEPATLVLLASFIDAHAVAGDAELLSGLRAELHRLVAADDALLGRFAAAIDAFPDASGSFWNRLLLVKEREPAPLDLKKAGLFPIVHGVRSLALREHLTQTGTAARLNALVALGRLPPDLAGDLIDSLHLLMGLRLKAGLAEPEAGPHSERLSSLERDLLKDALAVVKRFKALLRHQFHLGET